MSEIVIGNLEFMWRKQAEVLSGRRPSWIISVSFVPLIFAALRFLISFGERRSTNISFPVATTNYQDRIWLVLLGTYLFITAGVYAWALVSNKTQFNFPRHTWKKIWWYSAFDMISILLGSLITLDTSLQILEASQMPTQFLAITKCSALLLYIALLMLSFVFAVSRLFQPVIKSGLPLEVKFAIAIPIFMAAFSVLGNSFMSQPGRTDLIIFALLFLLVSFLLVPVWASGFVYMVMFIGFFPKIGHAQIPEEQDMWLQEISRWIEPGEKIEVFTIGYMQNGWSKIDVILALTDKYIRIGSAYGGRNIPRDEIQKVTWSDSLAQLRIFTNFSPSPLVISIFGKDWKERAKQFAR